MSEKPLAELGVVSLVARLIDLMRPGTSLDETVAEIRRRLEQGERDRNDRERLDWLHERGSVEIECILNVRGDRYAIDDQMGESNYKTLREAIDAARAEGK